MKNTIEQERHCLNVKMLCDFLRTEITMIDDFPNSRFYCNELKDIKLIADGIYWKL